VRTLMNTTVYACLNLYRLWPGEGILCSTVQRRTFILLGPVATKLDDLAAANKNDSLGLDGDVGATLPDLVRNAHFLSVFPMFVPSLSW
jgi:hypothetical protein